MYLVHSHRRENDKLQIRIHTTGQPQYSQLQHTMQCTAVTGLMHPGPTGMSTEQNVLGPTSALCAGHLRLMLAPGHFADQMVFLTSLCKLTTTITRWRINESDLMAFTHRDLLKLTCIF